MLQPANTNGENLRPYDGSTSESCFWTSKDPIRFAGGMNLFVYVGNDPVNGIDPEGKFWPIDFFKCVYYGWKWNNAIDKCTKQEKSACEPDCTSDACLEGGGQQSFIWNCVQQQDPSITKSMMDSCTGFGLGWAFGNGRVPGMSPPILPK